LASATLNKALKLCPISWTKAAGIGWSLLRARPEAASEAVNAASFKESAFEADGTSGSVGFIVGVGNGNAAACDSEDFQTLFFQPPGEVGIAGDFFGSNGGHNGVWNGRLELAHVSWQAVTLHDYRAG